MSVENFLIEGIDWGVASLLKDKSPFINRGKLKN